MATDGHERENWRYFLASLQDDEQADRAEWGDLDEETLARYVSGLSPPTERRRVEEVARVCPAVRELLDDLWAAPDPVEPPVKGGRFSFRAVALAAAAAGLLVAAGLLPWVLAKPQPATPGPGLAEARRAQAEAERAAALLQVERDEQQRLLEEARQGLADIQRNHERVQEQLRAKEDALVVANRNLFTARREKSTLEEQLADQGVDLAETKKALADVRKKEEILKAEVAEGKREVGRYREMLVSLQAENRELQDRIAKLALPPGAPFRREIYVSLEEGLLASVPDILKYCRGNDVRRLGVLKFRVRKEGDITRDRVGPLNFNLARRLEIALIIGNDRENPLDILKNASAVASRIPGADHLDRAARRLLFEDARGRPRPVFPLSWGKDPDARVAADAFVTGHVELRADGGPATVTLLGLDRRTLRLVSITRFRAHPSVDVLAEIGESYQLRGGSDGDPFALAAATRKGEVPLPVKADPGKPAEGPLPVELEIRYDGVPQKITLTGENEATVPEPKEGETVSFRLIRKDNDTDARYAVVLLVNGRNTLGMQRRPPDHCLKWVLSKGADPLTISGFYPNPLAALDEPEPPRIVRFAVSSPESSKGNAERFGDDCGQITFVVFREKGTPPPRLSPREEIEQKRRGLVRDGDHPPEMPADPFDARRKLLGSDPTPTRGLIEPASAGAIRKAKLAPLEQVSVLTITYFAKE